MDLNQKYQELAVAHAAHLAASGVKLPRFKGKLGCSLAILYANFGEFVHIDSIKSQLEEAGHTLTGTDPVQVSAHDLCACFISLRIIRDGSLASRECGGRSKGSF